MKDRIKRRSFLFRIFYKLILFGILILLISCEITSPEDIVQSGRIKVNLIFISSSEINISENDFLITQARDFKVFKDKNFADVFQHPNQFLEYSDSIVTFNLLKAALNKLVIQVAYGSVPPLNYDSLLFQITPSNIIKLENIFYPLTTNYNNLVIKNNFTKVVKIKNIIKVEENKTTTINVYFKVEEILFRVLDDFVFSVVVDSYNILNE